jgi:hypothetical protein
MKKFVFAIFALLSFCSFAGESLFQRAYTTETVPEGHFEIEQSVRNRNQRAYGEYSAYDFRSELEYGVTDKFQAAIYVNLESLHAKGAPDDNYAPGDTPAGFSNDSFFGQGLSAEFIYRVLSPMKDPIGLAFYYEPSLMNYDMHNAQYVFNGLENEVRVIVQKNYLEDQLVLVYNLAIEMEYFRYAGNDSPFQGELDWNNEIGGTYRVASNWYVGAEARNHNEFGNFWHHDHCVVWAGPVIHYGGEKIWATFGVLRQFYGNPNGLDDAGSDQGPPGFFLHSHEMTETTLKVGIPL